MAMSEDDHSTARRYAEVRQYCSAIAQALTDAGIAPGERWDEAGGTALYWEKDDPALDQGSWVNGVLVFWGTRGGRHGWGCAPLDASGDPEFGAVTWLPVDHSIAPDLLAEHLVCLFAEGIAVPGAERQS